MTARLSESTRKFPQTTSAAGRIGLKIVSDPATLAKVRQEVEALCSRRGFDAAATGEVGLCVNEALANVMRHAYAGVTDRPIEIESECDGAGVTIRIRDWGNGINPEALPPKRSQIDPLVPGGLGLLCLRRMMDEVEYAPQPDGMLLTMVKLRGCDSRPAVPRPKPATATDNGTLTTGNRPHGRPARQQRPCYRRPPGRRRGAGDAARGD